MSIVSLIQRKYRSVWCFNRINILIIQLIIIMETAYYNQTYDSNKNLKKFLKMWKKCNIF